MTTANFIKELAGSFSDSNFQLFSPEDWKEIINFQLKELAIDIAIKTTTEVTYDSSTLQIDLSASTFDDLISVNAILLEATNGRLVEYDHWCYLPEKKIVDLNPDSYKDPQKNIADYSKTYVRWSHYATELTDENDEIPIEMKNIGFLKKLCRKEALSRILMDKTKFKRYQVYAGNVSHFFILSCIKDISNEILSDKMLQRQNQVDTF